MAHPARLASAPQTAFEDPSPLLAAHLLALHETLTVHDFWRRLRQLLRDTIEVRSSALEVGHGGDGSRHRVYRQAHPTPPPEWWREHPVNAWLGQNSGVPVCRFSDVVSLEQLRSTPFYERVMRVEGWEHRLSVFSWRGRELQGALHLYHGTNEPDFSPRDVRLAQALQPHFHVALRRVLAHEEGVFRAEQYASMLEGVPVGLLLLDWAARPLWYNSEAEHACAVWNYGENRAAALKTRRAFRVPSGLLAACAALREQWENHGRHAPTVKPEVISEHELGLHAQITLRAAAYGPMLRPTFHVQLDYRRPRGDRQRPLSPGTVALLARFTAREREVAMRMREGLRNAEIAAELRRSPLTIKTQLAAIYGKLGVNGRTRAVALLNR